MSVGERERVLTYDTQRDKCCVCVSMCEILQPPPCMIKRRTVKLCENVSGSGRKQLERQCSPLFLSSGSHQFELSTESILFQEVLQLNSTMCLC